MRTNPYYGFKQIFLKEPHSKTKHFQMLIWLNLEWITSKLRSSLKWDGI